MKKNEYIAISNPANNDFVPVKILSIAKKEITVKILANEDIRIIPNYYLENYGYRKPYISEKIIENCGLKKTKHDQYEYDNIVLIKSFVSQNNGGYHFFSSNFLGYKFLTNSEVDDFRKLLSEIPFETNINDFKEKNSTITTIEEFINKINELKINNVNFEKLICEQGGGL